jgi:hypothetical protein
MVRYDDLLSDWMQALAQASETLDLALIDRAHPNQMRNAARLVDPTLRRARATWSSLGVDDRLVELAEETWGIFDRAVTTGRHDDPTMRSDLDRLREIYVSLYTFAESLAQSSVSAAQRDGRSRQRRGGAVAGNPPLLSVRGAHRLRRVKRKVRRALHQFRSRDGDPTPSGTAPEVESPPSTTQKQ